MILTFVFLALSITASCLTYFLTPLANYLYCLFVPFLLVIPYYILCFGLHVLFLTIVALFTKRDKVRTKRSWLANWEMCQTTYQCLLLLRVRVHVSGLEKLPKKGTFVIISNHLSDFDEFALLSRLPGRQIICISKPENFSIPVAGKWMLLAGFLPINRENPFEGVRTIRKAAQMVKDGVCSVSIAPEGTRSKDHKFHEFKAGSFRTATLAESPLAIACFQNTYKIKDNFPWKPTHIYFDVLDVLPYEEFKDMNTVELSDKAHKMIEDHLAEHPERNQ